MEEWRAVVRCADDGAVAAVRELNVGVALTGDGRTLIAYTDRLGNAEALRDQLVALLRHRTEQPVETRLERWGPARGEWLVGDEADVVEDDNEPEPEPEPKAPAAQVGGLDVVGGILDFLFTRP